MVKKLYGTLYMQHGQEWQKYGQYVFIVAFKRLPYSTVEKRVKVTGCQPTILPSGWGGASPYTIQYGFRISFRGERGSVTVVPSTLLARGDEKPIINQTKVPTCSSLSTLNKIVSMVGGWNQLISSEPRMPAE